MIFYQIRCKDFEHNTHKVICAYKDMDYALAEMRKMNAQCTDVEPYYVKKMEV